MEQLSFPQRDTAIEKCLKPRAFPEPVKSWINNREHSDLFSSILIRQTETGNLVIHDTEKSDAAEYFCQADNMIGTRKSDFARLSVHL